MLITCFFPPPFLLLLNESHTGVINLLFYTALLFMEAGLYFFLNNLRQMQINIHYMAEACGQLTMSLICGPSSNCSNNCLE